VGRCVGWIRRLKFYLPFPLCGEFDAGVRVFTHLRIMRKDGAWRHAPWRLIDLRTRTQAKEPAGRDLPVKERKSSEEGPIQLLKYMIEESRNGCA
jgi:hypothetical protein